MDRGAFSPVVLTDSEDPWEMRKICFGKTIGKFKLLSCQAGTKFSGIEKTTIDSVRIIEDGDVRTVVEVVFGFEESFICQRYKLPQKGNEIEVEMRVFWNQKNKMLKLLVPLSYEGKKYFGQTAFGVQELPVNGNESVTQKWVAVTNNKDNKCLSCINDGIYGSDFSGSNLRLSLLRAPAYSGHPIGSNEILSLDRFTNRIDQGERLFKFWINAGKVKERLNNISMEAIARNEKPFALSFFPQGEGMLPKPFAVVDNKTIEISTFKKAENSNDWIVRLFNSVSSKQTCKLTIPIWGISQKLEFGVFEVKTLKINNKGKYHETNLVEELI